MSCGCPCCNTAGHRINRRARIGARLVELRDRIQEAEKMSRKTPPKTLRGQWRLVESAKALLPLLVAERDALLVERAGLEPSAAAGDASKEGT